MLEHILQEFFGEIQTVFSYERVNSLQKYEN